MSTSQTTERRARLDRETVVVAAEGIVDRDGYDALSMTLLAAELESRSRRSTTTWTNLEELRSEIQVRAMTLLGRHVQRAAMGRAGADGLKVLSHELRDFALTFPQRYAAITRTPIDRDAFFAAAGEVIEAMGVMVRSTGLPDERILHTGMAIFSALHGFVSLEASGYFDGMDHLEDVFEQVVRGAVTAAVLEVTQTRD